MVDQLKDPTVNHFGYFPLIGPSNQNMRSSCLCGPPKDAKKTWRVLRTSTLRALDGLFEGIWGSGIQKTLGKPVGYKFGATLCQFEATLDFGARVRQMMWT